MDKKRISWKGRQCYSQVRGLKTKGRESTILSFHITLLHLGMVIGGLPHSFDASTIAGGDKEREISYIEKQGAYFQGKYVALIAKKLN